MINGKAKNQITLRHLKRVGYVCGYYQNRFTRLFDGRCELNQNNCKKFLKGASWLRITEWICFYESWKIDKKLAKHLECKPSTIGRHLLKIDKKRRPAALYQILYRMLKERRIIR